uniref:Ig-like domain-containing protein n=1 Tax=Oryzias sinensis TaxID=183150 RepID=A0A8C7XNP6_9TELE
MNGLKYHCGMNIIIHLKAQEVDMVVQSGGVLLGSSTILPCHINTNDRLSQITWQRTIKGKALDDVFLTIQPTIGPSYSNEKDFRFEFIGNFNNKNGTLNFSDVTLNDEGSYTCIFSLFPSGKQSRVSQLVILVPPITNLMDYTPLEGNEEVPLATCTAAASKPKADVRWIKGSLEGKVREELKETQHANGTTTTWSTLLGKPGREMNGQLVKCVISSEGNGKRFFWLFCCSCIASYMVIAILIINIPSFLISRSPNLYTYNLHLVILLEIQGIWKTSPELFSTQVFISESHIIFVTGVLCLICF